MSFSTRYVAWRNRYVNWKQAHPEEVHMPPVDLRKSAEEAVKEWDGYKLSDLLLLVIQKSGENPELVIRDMHVKLVNEAAKKGRYS